MFADEIRRAVETANRIALPQVTALLWRAYGEGRVTEAEAEALSALIELRQVSTRSGGNPPSPDPGMGSNARAPASSADRRSGLTNGGGSRPRTDASMERRRRWAASGRLPPGLAARFTLAEQAVLSLVAAETARRKDCRMAVEHMAAVAGVSRSTVKNAIRQARQLGLVSVEERKVTGWRNDTNVVRIVSREWDAWLRLARRASPAGGGVKSSTGTPTEVLELRGKRTAEPGRRAAEREKASPPRSDDRRVRFARDDGAERRRHALSAFSRSS